MFFYLIVCLLVVYPKQLSGYSISSALVKRIPALIRPTHGNPIHIWILEASMAAQDIAVEKALSQSVPLDQAEADPYGIVLWPAAFPVATVVADMIRAGEVRNVVEIGAGTGLVSLTAVVAGASDVLALDYNADTLRLLEKTADLNLPHGGPRERLRTELFDVTSCGAEEGGTNVPYEGCGEDSALVVADLLYSPRTSRAVAHCVAEAVGRGMRVVVGDCGRPGADAFLKELQSCILAAVESRDPRVASSYAASFPESDTNGSPVAAWTNVDAKTIVSPRNSLIAAQHDEEKPIKVGLIEIAAAGGERFTSRLAL